MNGKAVRIAVVVLVLAAAAGLVAQDIQHETGTLNIEIPVRVFKGDAFVDGVTIADFEVYEDGKLQTARRRLPGQEVLRRAEGGEHGLRARHGAPFLPLLRADRVRPQDPGGPRLLRPGGPGRRRRARRRDAAQDLPDEERHPPGRAAGTPCSRSSWASCGATSSSGTPSTRTSSTR
ncbi:MAG: hypothetical protein MZV63_58710 [Marinilabiliales bacterium]|nr:hypothetical protein [Marinilabiliales bacterium]